MKMEVRGRGRAESGCVGILGFGPGKKIRREEEESSFDLGLKRSVNFLG